MDQQTNVVSTVKIISSALKAPSGYLVTFEGIDGTGKSTQCRKLMECLQHSSKSYLFIREPGGTQLGEAIREILLNSKESQIDPISELLLYEAARAQLVSEVIKPALEQNIHVICDRFFDSTTAYQGFGRNLGFDLTSKANSIACQNIVPHKTVLFVLDPYEALKRATKQGADRMESAGVEFMARVQEGYITLAKQNPERFVIIDASAPEDVVWNMVADALSDLFVLPKADD